MPSLRIPAARPLVRIKLRRTRSQLFTQGVGGAPGGASLEQVALVRRNATLARRRPSRANRDAASRRSTVAMALCKYCNDINVWRRECPNSVPASKLSPVSGGIVEPTV